MLPLRAAPSLANACGVPSPASNSFASIGAFVDGLMGAAAIRILKVAGEIADASAVTGSHILLAVNGSTLTFWIPMSRNFFAAHTMARSQATEPVGRPPMPSHNSRRSVNSGVSPFARAASLFGGAFASKLKALEIKTQRRHECLCHKLAVRIITGDRSFFHHEENLFSLANILQKIAGNHHDVSQLAQFQRTHAILKAQ